jgi:TonB family protein
MLRRNNDGVDELVVPLAEALSLRGTIAYEGAVPRPEHIDVWLAPQRDWVSGEFGGDWFTLGGLTAGRYAVLVTENGPEARWFVQSVIAAGRDLAGAPLTIGHDVIQRVAVVMRDRASPLEGTVVVDAVIRQDGTVSNVTVLSSTNKLFEQACIEAVRQWRFTPGPQDVVLTVTVNFTLK